MKNQLKAFIRRFFRNKGYLIAKHPRVDYTVLSIFDVLVLLMMRSQGTALRFVQVGANDGVYGDSISRYAFKYPWQGILVEPQPDIFAKLVENYRSAPAKSYFENCAIADKSCREITLWRQKPAAEGSFDSTIASARRRGEGMEAIQVPCMTLSELLDKHGWTQVNILLIDTEGLDFEVLKSLELSRCTPGIIQFEHGHLSPLEIDQAVALLQANAYHILYGGTQFDTLAVHQSLWVEWQNLRT